VTYSYYIVRYETSGGVKEARVYAPGELSAATHIRASRRDVVLILNVAKDES
jgi:hypothetical protein